MISIYVPSVAVYLHKLLSAIDEITIQIII